MKSTKKVPVKRYYIRSVSPKLPDNNRVSILDRYKHSYARKDVAKIASALQAKIADRDEKLYKLNRKLLESKRKLKQLNYDNILMR